MKGHIVKRSDTSWSLVFDLGVTPEGKRKQKWVTVKGTRRDAEKELTRLLHELDSGSYVDPSKQTVAQYLQYWLDNYARTNVTGKTFDGYYEIATLHLVPALGRHRLSELKPAHIQAYYTRALTSGRRQKAGGLSARSVLHHHRVLRNALQQAVKWQMLARNPADAVVPPRPERPEMRTLNEDEAVKLLATVEGTHNWIPILLAITTGMRRGEILGLRWQDVDLVAKTLCVRQTLSLTRAGLVFKPPKTKKSQRTITLPEFVVDALRWHHEEQIREREVFGASYEDHDLVVAQATGAPRSPGGFSAAFVRVIARSGVPRVRLHDMRHSHATHLLKLKVHPKVVSERLGHSTVVLTLDTYSHVLPNIQVEVADQVDAAYREARERMAKPPPTDTR
jgi:integrase